MRACLLPLLLICSSAWAEGSDMQWQAPRILPPKGEAAPAASAPARPSAAPGKAPTAPASSAAPASASAVAAGAGKPPPGASTAAAKSASAPASAPASASGKPSTAPQLAAAIKDKLEATQAPAPRPPRGGDRSSGSSFMTQEEFRSRLAAAAAAAKAQPPAPKVINVMQTRKAPSPPPPKPRPRPGYWSYSGEAGPEHWGELSADWARCGNGTRQSPIDIRDGFKLELEPPLFEYQASQFAVLDNGHTIQVNLNSPNFASVMGRRFKLQQFHFHRPSEEKIEGRGSEMVMHLVHKDEDGRLLVVAVLIERGEPNAQVQTVWNNLPLEKNDSVTASGRLELEQLLPARREYYTYMGSLTTPPCSEGVLWVVLKQPITLSSQQIALFARLYPMNARPLQASGERMIKESN